MKKRIILAVMTMFVYVGIMFGSKNTLNADAAIRLEESVEQTWQIKVPTGDRLIDCSEMQRISIESNNLKDSYLLGEELDLSELKVYAVYSDGTKLLLDEEQYLLSIPETDSYGTKYIMAAFINSKIFVDFIDFEVKYTLSEIEPETAVASTALNLRKGPGTEYDVEKVLKKNDSCVVIGVVAEECGCPLDWVKVKCGDEEYFFNKNYLLSC